MERLRIGEMSLIGKALTGASAFTIAISMAGGEEVNRLARAQSPEPQPQIENQYEVPAEKVYKCDGQVATIVGTRGSDRLIGTARRDVIAALSGDDRINGKGGNDLVCAGDGNDRVDGGSGADEIFGQSGFDVIRGQNGPDTGSGGAGVDLLLGGSGRDSLSGGTGDDELVGSSFDRLSGQRGDDWCRGSRRVSSCESIRGIAKATGTSKRAGKGQLYTYNVFVERGIGIDRAGIAEEIDEVLADKRSWIRSGRVSFKRVSGPASTQIILATPAKVDAVCATVGLNTAGRVSCRAGSRIMLNLNRWRYAVPHWPKGQVRNYHRMLLNHEMGHRIGKGHAFCSGPGRKAPVMQQQTKFLLGCKANPWPLPGE